MYENYVEELEFIIKEKNDIFPDFLFNPLFNDFNDNYLQHIVEDKSIIEIQKIRRKYRDYFDFNNALILYNKYMGELIEKYGSKSIVRNSVKYGLLTEYMPPKPKLKLNSSNKELLRARIFPSEKIIKENDTDTMKEIMIELFPINNSEIENIKEEFNTKLNKKNKKVFEEISSLNRRKNMYRSNNNNQGIDFIIEYMNQVNKGYYDDTGKKHEYSLKEIMKQKEYEESLPEEILEYLNDPSPSIIVNGRLVNKKEQEKINILSDLYKIGINLIDNGSIDKRSVKMIKLTSGVEEDPSMMSNKELKKYKKKIKREKKALRKRSDNDKILAETLLGNRINLNSKDNNLNFKLRDLYKS
jgi:hypothetical protein